MAGINTQRCIAGGLAAAAVIWLMEGAASILYMDEMTARLDALGLSMELSPGIMALTVLVSVLVGLVLVFFYAAARPRFGPGPKTAATVAAALWAGSYLVSLIGFHMIGLYPPSMLAIWALVGLVEMIVAAMVGGWIYREEGAAA